MLLHFRFNRGKSRAFWVKYVGADYCKIPYLACPQFLKWLLTLETIIINYTYCISGTNITGSFCDILSYTITRSFLI